MAILKYDGRSVEVKDGDAILDAAEELGIPFGCTRGECGTCQVTVLEGLENLDEKSPPELDMCLSEGQRLACQCRIQSGTVVLDY